MRGWLIMGFGVLVLDVVAVGVFTGHTERFFRALPMNNLDTWNSVGGSGCSTWFLRVWASFVFFMTAVIWAAILIAAFRS